MGKVAEGTAGFGAEAGRIKKKEKEKVGEREIFKAPALQV